MKTPGRIDDALKTNGRSSISSELQNLGQKELDELEEQTDSLARKGLGVVLRGDPAFPKSLIVKNRTSSPILFYLGNLKLLGREGIGMCGSRAASELGLKAAGECGEEVSRRELSVISGYAKGVDTATHLAALQAGGNTVIVLAEGFDHFRVKQTFQPHFDLNRVLVISQFAPSQPWLAHAAMTRNKVIFGLGRALVVVEAGEKGGTLAAGEGALQIGRPVFVLNFGDETPTGNRILLGKGGYSIRSREQLGEALDRRPKIEQAQMMLPL